MKQNTNRRFVVALPPFSSHSIISIDHVRYIILVSTRFFRLQLVLSFTFYCTFHVLAFFPFFSYLSLFSPSTRNEIVSHFSSNYVLLLFLLSFIRSKTFLAKHNAFEKGNRIGAVVLTSLRAFMLNVVHNVEQFGKSEIYTTIN